MKEDVLEQVVEDYLHHRGYFTMHNIKFKPSEEHADFVQSEDSVHSDIDIIGVNPLKLGAEQVMVVSCKSWQSGFDATAVLRQLEGTNSSGKVPAWKRHRELWNPKWATAFRSAVTQLTGANTFSYRIAVTKVSGDVDAWASNPRIVENLQGSTFGFLTFAEMWESVAASGSKTPANSQLGRLLQLLHASGVTVGAPKLSALIK